MRLFAAILLLVGGALGQDTQTPQKGDPTFRVDVRLVDVFTTVTDANGAPVTDLKKDDFALTEDGVVQNAARAGTQYAVMNPYTQDTKAAWDAAVQQAASCGGEAEQPACALLDGLPPDPAAPVRYRDLYDLTGVMVKFFNGLQFVRTPPRNTDEIRRLRDDAPKHLREAAEGIDRLAGSATADLSAAGTLSAPRVEGAARLDEVVVGWWGTRTLSGSVELAGSWNLDPDLPLEGELRMTPENLRLDYDGLRGTQRFEIRGAGLALRAEPREGLRVDLGLTASEPGRDSVAVITAHGSTENAVAALKAETAWFKQEGRYVFVVKPDGTAESRRVVVAREVGRHDLEYLRWLSRHAAGARYRAALAVLLRESDRRPRSAKAESR